MPETHQFPKLSSFSPNPSIFPETFNSNVLPSHPQVTPTKLYTLDLSAFDLSAFDLSTPVPACRANHTMFAPAPAFIPAFPCLRHSPLTPSLSRLRPACRPHPTRRVTPQMSRRARIDPRDEAFVTCPSCGSDEPTSASALLRAGTAVVRCGQCRATWTARAEEALTGTGGALVAEREAEREAEVGEEEEEGEGVVGRGSLPVKLFVGGLGPKVGGEVLRTVMEQFGEVVEARVVYDRVTGRSRGFGFVTMVGRSAAMAAMDVLSGDSSTPLGRRLKVREAIE